MDIAEIRDLNDKDIEIALTETREELMRLRFQQTTGELVDHNQIPATRKKIARLLTVLNERKQAATKEGEA